MIDLNLLTESGVSPVAKQEEINPMLIKALLLLLEKLNKEKEDGQIVRTGYKPFISGVG